MVSDLEWAIKQVQSRRQEKYVLYRNYYEGEHRLAFASEKFRNTFGTLFKEFAENVCAPVVDSLSDRLVITGFKTNQAETVAEEIPSVLDSATKTTKVTVRDETADEALEIWRYNRMDLQSNEIHTESLKEGDAYAIVWPNEEGRAEVFPNYAANCAVEYDPQTRKKVLRGAKVWWDWIEGRWYVTLYFPDRLEKYRQRSTSQTLAEKSNGFILYEEIPNPYGEVPLFHFPNKRIAACGVSELQNVIPLQDGLNKAVMDMMIAMEFASFKQRYVIGLEVEVDETTGEPTDPTYRNYGADRMMAIPDPDAKVGQFDATDLGQFLRVQEKFWASAARVSGTPLHYFFITQGDFPSGEAMKSAEARFVKKIKDRQIAFGNVWENVVKFALKIEGKEVPDDLQVEALWLDAAPKSEAELADTAVKKKAVGVSRSQLLKEMGYDDETVYRMLEETDAHNAAQAAAKQRADEEATNPNGQPKPTESGTKGVPK